MCVHTSHAIQMYSVLCRGGIIELPDKALVSSHSRYSHLGQYLQWNKYSKSPPCEAAFVPIPFLWALAYLSPCVHVLKHELPTYLQKFLAKTLPLPAPLMGHLLGWADVNCLPNEAPSHQPFIAPTPLPITPLCVASTFFSHFLGQKRSTALNTSATVLASLPGGRANPINSTVLAGEGQGGQGYSGGGGPVTAESVPHSFLFFLDYGLKALSWLLRPLLVFHRVRVLSSLQTTSCLMFVSSLPLSLSHLSVNVLQTQRGCVLICRHKLFSQTQCFV